MIYLSFDQDWAPEWATRSLHDRVVAAGQTGTLFVTHPCPSLTHLRSVGRFELGWHPNFLPGSSHGDTTEEVLDTMAGWVPEARGARAHCLIRGTPYLQAYRARGLVYDAADILDGAPNLAPFVSWTGMTRLPIWFEDDVHIARGLPCALSALALEQPGMKVFNFHPVLVALNARTSQSYANLKADLSLRGVGLTDATPEDFQRHREQDGVSDLLSQVLDFMVENPQRAGRTLYSAV